MPRYLTWPYAIPGSTALRTTPDRFADLLSVKEFGAVGDGVHDDTAAIQGAIDALEGRRGVVLLPDGGTYIVHLSTPVDTGSANWRVAALTMPNSGTWLVGQPGLSTTIKCQATDGSYGVIQMMKTPLENGVVKITRSGLCNLILDGNYDGLDVEGIPVLNATGIQDCAFINLVVCNSRSYGFGLQNGACVGITVRDMVIENTTRDAIDMKDNGELNTNNRFENITLRDVCKGNLTESFAGLDLMGLGLVVDGVNMETFSTNPTASMEAVVRIKQGQPGDSRGLGGRYSRIRNVYINKNAGGMCAYGIVVKAPFVRIETPVIRGVFIAGIRLTQRHQSVIDPDINIPSPGYGVFCTIPGGSTLPGDYDYDSADYALIEGGSILNCLRGVAVTTTGVRVRHTVFEGCVSAIHVGGTSAINGWFSPIVVDPPTLTAWATGQTIAVNDIRTNAGKGYIATTAGTTGATPPVHTGSTPVTDGGVDWRYECYLHEVHFDTDRNGMVMDAIGAPGLRHKLFTSAGAIADVGAVFWSNYRFLSNYTGTDFTGIAEQFRVANVAAAVNYVSVQGGAVGAPAQVNAAGTDTDVDLRLSGKGAGLVRHGTLTATADAPVTGYITIKDAGGTVRKLAVIT